ncbi:MAG: OsmC family protein [Desulfobacterales bacterium]|nr:MAG: OsmC family protein [Desulfobacterales bacterium]
MSLKKLHFESTNKTKLSALLELPVDGHPVAYALFAHCFTCTKNLKAIHHISRALARENIAVLRFDFTGLGESEGDFADTTFSSNVEDLVAAANFLHSNFAAPRVLIGHSLGGAAVLQAAAHIPSCKAVATIGAPADPVHVTHLLKDQMEDIEQKGEAEVSLEGRNFKIKKQFIDDLEQTRMEGVIRNLKKALLIFHSPIDNTVGIDNAAKIFQAARHPKSFISLDQADHLLMKEADSLYVGAMIAAWARKYIKTPRDEPEKRGVTDNRVVTRTGKTGYRTEIMANGLPLIADEPISLGGTNMGPSPYEYLVAALGACTSMTLRMYADRKKLPLEEISVTLSHNKIHAKDCETCDTKNRLVDNIEREVELIGPLDDAQRQRMLEIADMCPVHRTLQSDVVIKTRLKP